MQRIKLRFGSLFFTATLLLYLGVAAHAQDISQATEVAQADAVLSQAKKLYNEAYGDSISTTRPLAETEKFASLALERFKEAQRLYASAGLKLAEAESWEWIAKLTEPKDPQLSLDGYGRALTVYVAVGDKLRMASVTGKIALVRYQIRDYQTAARLYNEATVLAREARDPDLERRLISSAGQAYSALGQYPKALEAYDQALAVARKNLKPDDELFTLNLLAGTHSRMGERRRAIETYERVLAINRALGYKVYEAMTLSNMAHLYALLNEHAIALDHYFQVLKIYRQFKMKSFEADALENIGIVYSKMDQPKPALEYVEQALKIDVELGAARSMASRLRALALIYQYDLNDRKKASEYLQSALPLLPEGSQERAETLMSLSELQEGTVHGREKAVDLKRQALNIYKTIGDREGQAATFKSLGVMQSLDGKWGEAKSYLILALMLYRVSGLRAGEAEAMDWLGTTWEWKENRQLAILFRKLAVSKYQELRINVRGFDKETQKNYLKNVENSFRELAILLLDAGRLAEALQIITLLKDQQFFDIADSSLAEAPLTLTDREFTYAKRFAEESDRFSSAYLAMNEDDVAQKKRGSRPATKEESERSRSVEDHARKSAKVYEALVAEAETEFLKPVETDREMSTRELQQLQTVFRENAKRGEAAAAIYQIAADSELYSLIVGPNSIRKVSVDIDSGKLLKRPLQLWALLQSDKYDPRVLGRELYDIVFRPIEKELPVGTETILWSMDGNLRYVPMAALYDGKQYLVERFNNVVFTRADSDRLTRAVSSKWTASVFGSSKAHSVEVVGDRIAFSALPGVGAELDTLLGNSKRRGVLSGNVLLDETFTQKAMLEQLSAKSPVVHIASHFSFRPGDESRSFLLLGDGTPFTLAEMKTQKDLFAGVELLTLSACNTAAQQADANGREVDAFFELAQRLGAQSVLATLWPVADSSTPWLMREFYDLKVNKHENKAEALRNAQLALLRGTAKTSRSTTRSDVSQVKIIVEGDTTPSAEAAATPPKIGGELNKTVTRAETFTIAKKDAKPFVADPKRPFAHPFYWSPFVLIGNWR